MNYFISALKNFSDIRGRARRSEYWFFTLFGIISIMLLAGLFGFLQIFWPIIIIYFLFLIPALTVGIRRMHDVGKSGWYLLIPIYSIILTFTEGEKGPNKWGPDPKA